MKKLLLVDSSLVIINVLKDFFSEDNDFKLFSAKSFKDLEKLVKENNFFASISNIVLPDALNGENLKLLKEKEIPTIVLTSKLDQETIKKVRDLEVVNYTSKDSLYELKSVYNLVKLLTFIDSMEVLVVDDSAVIVSKIKHILETLLLKVNIAKNGKEALEVLKNNSKISLIITDYHMDELDGLEFVKQARKNNDYVKTPIIIMTVEADNNLKIKFFKNGVTDFLTKPILEEELKAKLINIFSNEKYIHDIHRFHKVVDENVITSSTDEKGIIKKVSKAYCDISGYEEKELIGNTHNIFNHPDIQESVYSELWETITSGKKWEGELKKLNKNGTSYWVKIIIEPDFDNHGKIVGYTSISQDITDRKRIYELSITDGLTKLYNRHHFNDISSTILESSLRKNNVFGFVLLDIDNFKKYNDTYGHQAGDNVLIEISKSLQNSFKRSDDMVFRLGGEEFGVLLCTMTKEDMILLVEESRANIESLNIEHKGNDPYFKLTASFGLTILDKKNDVDDLVIDAIYKMSDYYLYKAKKLGRNRIEYKN